MLDLRIPPKHAVAVELSSGKELSVVDPNGGQVADLVAFDPVNSAVRSSTKYTMRQTGRLRITTGDQLYSTIGEPMLTIVSDDCGVHDLLFAPCNSWTLEKYDQGDEQGCQENLAEVLIPWDVPKHLLQEPMNVFMHTTVPDHNYVDDRKPVSQPGDTVSFQAESTVVVAVSACVTEATVNAGKAAPIDLRLPEDAKPSTNF